MQPVRSSSPSWALSSTMVSLSLARALLGLYSYPKGFATEGTTEMRRESIDGQTTDLRVRNLLLMALTASSGAVDAISYLGLGKVFTAFITGNFVFLGLVAAALVGPSVVSLAVTLAAFAAGVYLATRIVEPSRGRA